jgi:hypothetical protein
MLNDKLLKIANNYLNENLNDVALKLKHLDSVEKTLILNYINGKNKIAQKIPDWQSKAIIFPVKLSIEQSSSQETAQYKSSLFKGENFLDLTCGFGVDTYFLSKSFKKCISLEANKNLAEIVQHNFNVLKANNVEIINETAEHFLEKNKTQFNYIFVDPDRRNEANKKLFLLEDCSPNIIEIWDKMLNVCDNVVVKCSPMADISYLRNSLSNIFEIFVIAINNECKEILIHASKHKKEENFVIKIVDINNGIINDKIQFSPKEEEAYISQFGDVEKYIYELPKSWTKAGLLKLPQKWFPFKKISANTHWFSSDLKINDFCGKTYLVISNHIYKPKELKKTLKGGKFQIKIKNFPFNLNEIKTQLAINEGGNKTIFCFSDQYNTLRLILAERII